MTAGAIWKNRKISISRPRFDRFRPNLPGLGPISTKFGMLTNFDPLDHSGSCNVHAAYCAIMSFSTDSLQLVGCCTSVIFLFLTKLLRNLSHLFMIKHPNDYLTVVIGLS